MHFKEQFTEEMTEEMIEHLRKHPELFEQRQGMDIMQNFFVINPKERQAALKDVLDNMKDYRQKIFDDLNATLTTHNIAASDIDIINNILETFPDEKKPRSGLDIPKMRELAVRNATFIVLSFNLLIEAWERDIEKFPDMKAKLQVHIDNAKHVLLDFTILLTLKFPHSTPYLREFKEKYKID